MVKVIKGGESNGKNEVKEERRRNSKVKGNPSDMKGPGNDIV